jgi:hypothetical protein
MAGTVVGELGICSCRSLTLWFVIVRMNEITPITMIIMMIRTIYWMNGGGSFNTLGQVAPPIPTYKPAFASSPHPKADRPDTSGNDL